MKLLPVILLIACSGMFFHDEFFFRQPLLGKWRYIESSGGFTGKGTGWDAQKTIRFEFRRKGIFRHYVGNKLRDADKFRITDRKLENEEIVRKVIDYEKNPDQFYLIKGDTLFLQEDVADGFNYTFVRI